jgi:SpoIID/LytB domain protein
MSQIGAKARAVAGESATAILQYYFKDVAVIPVVDTATIRVNIGHALSSASFTPSAGSLLAYYQGDISISDTKTTPLFMSSKKQKLKISADKKSINGPITSPVMTIRWREGVLPLVSVTQGAVSVKYRYGQIQVKVVKGALEVTNSLSLHDEYLLGISEVSSSWPSAVLEAQTIASRSYGLSKISKINTLCDCNVYAHTADQNFVGYSKEAEAKYGQLWRAAVMRTTIDTSTGLAILSNGKPIQAYFFSSSGGATQSSFDAWGGVTSYTHSVADTASVMTSLNPRFASWNSSSEQNLVAQAFGLSDVVKLEIVSRNSAGAVTWIKATSQSGATKTLRGDTFRSRAKLPSPWFDLVGVQY